MVFFLIDGLKTNFALSDVVMSALCQTFKETRAQLTKDVRYLKVMKPKSLDASSHDVDCEPAEQNNQKRQKISNNNNKSTKIMD